ncbi:chitosanase [Janthinobacterium agaricidamnosum]|uniref:Chitosanase n=1 Tax=Janthinobacterium agaricidamnosum NBRC 102515 = DSM 9628 TaxID=1349767 RepID=W0V529_9BURK|nr:chitosanase [Janthinobacterium agaricidamnosum]CDG82438.1 chitosanase [Janthinobacterium agaricidamnosum NBRC 102515 = DSM 9628]
MNQYFPQFSKQLVACVASAVLVVGCGGGNEPIGSSRQAAQSVAVAAAIDHDARFPAATLQFLKDTTGLDGEQWDNIMQLVNKPEQDQLDWTKFYGYCEKLGDGRGYTIGIFGATTGGSNDANPDGPELFTAFDRASGTAVPSIAGGLALAGLSAAATPSANGKTIKVTDGPAFIAGVAKLQDNLAWQDAMWKTFYKVYIQYSVQQASQRGFADALTIGSFVDTALNQGADGGKNTLEGLLKRTSTSTDEVTFLTDFYAKRALVVDTNQFNQKPNGAHRVQQWLDLMNLQLFSLKNADDAVVKVTSWVVK